MTSLLFYEEPVALNNALHRNSRVLASQNYAFASKTNSVVLTSMEFIEACKEYPIVFAKVAADKMVPVALLGLRENENLFVDAAGKWNARYIPAFVRRYPFVLAETGKNEELAVCVEKASLSDSAGEALFDAAGQQTPYLQNALSFMQQYQQLFLHTDTFVKHLRLLELMTEMNAKTVLSDQTELVLRDFHVVNEPALQKLDRAKASGLLRTGELGLVYAHLISLSNFSRLVDLVAARAPQAA